MTEETQRTITLKRGGSGEVEVPVEQIQVPDLWHIAQFLEKTGEQVYVVKDGEFTWVKASDYVLECWNLAHAMRRHIQANG